ncbi:sugar ABC transporter permease [Paenibacillus sp. IB182496]|uniref:Sugar ABC transporter permease n=1 Tax=Paenibacillus sabuli TaxID=2772509 RepID=A0A927GRC3_9BACL|nr:sugar ABC transporter permease [Paenibacillus sabuli]MBD2845474.1 sugar ABC transporter permease [Paenibacillus sabuli]
MNQPLQARIHTRGYSLQRKLAPWLLLAPPILLTAWLKYYLIIKAFYMSLFDYNAIEAPGPFVGFANYARMFSTQYYWDAWSNTFVFLFLTLIMTFLIPIVQALFLNELIRLRHVFTTLYIVPALIPTAVNMIIWKWIWHPDYGVANRILLFFGGQPQAWLSDPDFTKFCIVFPGVLGGGLSVLLYLSAIQGISREMIESSQLDGCTGWRRIVHIILPNIRFLIFIQLVMAVILTMQLLDAPYMYTAGGPSGASTTMGVYIYNTFQQDFNYGRGSSASIVLLCVIAVMSAVQMKLDRSQKN